MKRPLINASLLFTALALPGLASAATLNVGIIDDPASLSPPKITGGVWEEDVLRDIFAGLVDVSEDGKVIPGVATRWDISDDGKTYTFHLRDSKWSDGEPVTAHDFVFALRYMINPKNAATGVERLYPLENAENIAKGNAAPDTLGVTAPDDHTLVFKLNEPAAYFLKMLVLPPFYPLPEHAVKQYGDQWSKADNIVVNGAFKPVKWVQGTELDTRKNDNYYDAKDVSLDGVTYYPMPDREAGITRFRSGELDILRDFPAARYKFLQKSLGDSVKITPNLGTEYYVFNLREGHPTADPKVREALSIAINRTVIANQLLEGAVKPAYSLVPPGASDYSIQVQPGLKHDIDERQQRARELLKEAGYGPDKPLKLSIRYNSGDQQQRVAVAIAAMWKPLGVQVTMNNSDSNVHYSTLRRGDFEIGRAAWISSYDDPQNFLQLVYNVGNNYGDYQDSEFRKLFSASNTEMDKAKRRSLLQQAEARLSSQYIEAPIFHYTARNLVKTDISGWQNNALDIHPARWVDKKD
ncbi:peptide ABC transporter substrate-binding protein [Carnimonas nigrificans]|uniref:peptide ABC transporter substrate-binding protein n=1 Tax=Carnimonas nigrificans TaxID=64323 RepID=UPI00047002F4|nr:peptide ABC transporter substrate-binding protein [Carnimonas nigrificans]